MKFVFARFWGFFSPPRVLYSWASTACKKTGKRSSPRFVFSFPKSKEDVLLQFLLLKGGKTVIIMLNYVSLFCVSTCEEENVS